MGLMIYDNKDGDFDLQLDNVRAYSANGSFTLDQYQWKKRALVVNAAAEDDSNLEQQRAAVASAADDFADRDMVLVTLLDDGVSLAGDRQLTDSEADTVRSTLGIDARDFAVKLVGKDGSVKLSKEAVTSMDEIFSLIDTMPMRRREIADR
jgi:hypothetical protein